MNILRDQSDIGAQVPLSTERVDDTSVSNTASGEALTWFYVTSGAWASATGQAAGTIVTGKLTYSGILNSMGTAIGSDLDSSFSLAAATRFNSRIEIDPKVFSDIQYLTPAGQAAAIGALLTQRGHYAVDHRRGQVWGKALDTVANDAATYKYQTTLTGGGTGDKVDLIKVGGTAITAVGSTLYVPTTLTGGSKTVATSGTAEALGASLATKSIYIRAKAANTSFICVGDSAVDKTTNQQIVLYANDSVTLDIANLATVYIDADVNAEGVDYMAMS